MARKCDITNKSKQRGNNVSHAMNRTIKHFKPNLHKVKVVENGTPKTLKVSSRALKSIKKGKIKGVKLAHSYTPEK